MNYLKGVVVDTAGNTVWLCTGTQEEQVELGTIVFDHWPHFELDCKLLKEMKESAFAPRYPWRTVRSQHEVNKVSD